MGQWDCGQLHREGPGQEAAAHSPRAERGGGIAASALRGLGHTAAPPAGARDRWEADGGHMLGGETQPRGHAAKH